ncbi:uncharacterized protein EDB91DRAFT_1116920 [Suillus paluster]|uniref:uncharacterized protein n=1 Tax=Suillus paluster TaxID=48578 RepID=UPI001B85C4B4|nr:uncharacterized protein EDB91DRAFT_1116920 [Suillus paluster]KAG1747200.1 hypothetical protein EDB91DRAFT_1116920 [Suillus paluster]
MVYFGPAKEARRCFTDMGYKPCQRRHLTHFLLSFTDPDTSTLFEGTIPRTVEEMTVHYCDIYVGKPDASQGGNSLPCSNNRPPRLVMFCHVVFPFSGSRSTTPNVCLLC